MGRKFFKNLLRQFTRIDMILMALLALVVLWFNLFAGIAAILAVACVFLRTAGCWPGRSGLR